jgi:prolyl-tRNA editing enzyme YbaK/EbsC (Cys-tRNA(Pro) deacylase)
MATDGRICASIGAVSSELRHDPAIPIHPSRQRVVEAADRLGLEIEVRHFVEPTKTIGVSVGQIVKSLIFAVGESSSLPGEPVLALVSGSNQVDEKKLARAAGAKRAWRIDANTVRTVTGYVIGGIPPFGHDTHLRTFADVDLLQYDVVWAAAGTSNDNFSSTPSKLIDVTTAIAVELAKLSIDTP